MLLLRLGDVHRLPFITCDDEHCLKPNIYLASPPSYYSDHSQHTIGMVTTTWSASTLPSGKAAVLTKNDDDVVIVAAVRSAMTKVSLEALLSRFPS